MAERGPTLLELAIRRVGVVRASRACAVMVQWNVAREALGEEWPAALSDQVAAYSEWWRHHERTGWRDLERFRAAYPGEESPERLLALARDQWDARRGVAGLGAVRLAL